MQVTGCALRCACCDVPETNERANGRFGSIETIVNEIDERRDLHDGVTILGGEPFDQAESLSFLVENLKAKNYFCPIPGFARNQIAGKQSLAEEVSCTFQKLEQTSESETVENVEVGWKIAF